MNQKELITAIQTHGTQYREGGLLKADIEAVLGCLADVATEQMQVEGGEIPLPGIGKLKAATRAARKGVNPATGAEIEIPARNAVKFVTAKALKDALK